jgi:hypothetical protein
MDLTTLKIRNTFVERESKVFRWRYLLVNEDNTPPYQGYLRHFCLNFELNLYKVEMVEVVTTNQKREIT